MDSPDATGQRRTVGPLVDWLTDATHLDLLTAPLQQVRAGPGLARGGSRGRARRSSLSGPAAGEGALQRWGASAGHPTVKAVAAVPPSLIRTFDHKGTIYRSGSLPSARIAT